MPYFAAQCHIFRHARLYTTDAYKSTITLKYKILFAGYITNLFFYPYPLGRWQFSIPYLQLADSPEY